MELSDSPDRSQIPANTFTVDVAPFQAVISSKILQPHANDISGILVRAQVVADLNASFRRPWIGPQQSHDVLPLCPRTQRCI